MSVAVHAESSEWRVLWERMKEKQPSISACRTVVQLDHLPHEVFDEVCAYVKTHAQWDDVASMITCFLLMARRNKSQNRDVVLEQWFAKIKGMLSNKRWESSLRMQFWVKLLQCREKRFAMRAWGWFVRQRCGLRPALHFLSHELENIASIHPDIGDAIMQNIVIDERHGSEHHLGRLWKVRKCTRGIGMRDDVIDIMLEHAGSFDQLSLGRELCEIFRDIPEWRKRILDCIETNGISDEQILINLVWFDTPDRPRAWEIFLGHHGEHVQVINRLIMKLTIHKNGDVDVLLLEAWHRVKSRLGFQELIWIVVNSVLLRQEALEQISLRAFNETDLLYVITTTNMQELRVHLITLLFSRGCSHDAKQMLRSSYANIVRELVPEEDESVLDIAQRMIDLNRHG